ncbi:hypothetical protein ACFOHW_13510 [Paenibacillus abyssi]|uniref:hypothetical protein n=1 Tax=Paenibacillus abyssi TaxID=1340531 RepID=UPI0036167664
MNTLSEVMMVVLATKEAEKEAVINKLKEMGLDQIAIWIDRLPDDKWEGLLQATWPSLAKQCGLQRD